MQKFRSFYLSNGNKVGDKSDFINHIHHLEDSLFIHKEKTEDFIYYILNDLNNNKARISTKIDGAPSLTFGVDPRDKKFFVSTKSITNKTPKLAKSESDIKELFEDKGLQLKLKEAFNSLASMPIDTKFLYQADFLYSKRDKKKSKTDDKKWISFKPNTIQYTINSDSDLYESVDSSDLGLALHTKYVFKINESGQFITTKVYPDFSDILEKETSIFFYPIEINSSKIKHENSLRIESFEFWEDLKSLDNIEKNLLQFSNSEVKKSTHNLFSDLRTGKPDLNRTLTSFRNFINSKYMKEIAKLKSPKHISQKQSYLNEYNDMIKSRKDDFKLLFQDYNNLIKIKTNLIEQCLSEDHPFQTFILDNEAQVPVKGEGFVLIDSNNNVIKLVDREEFSKINLLKGQFQK